MPADLTQARARLTQQRHDLLTNPFTPTRTSVDSPWTTREGALRSIDDEFARLDRLESSRRSHNRLVNIGRVATAAPFAVAGGAALLGAGGAGAAVSAAPEIAFSTAPAAGTAAAVGAPAAAAGVGAAGAATGAGMTLGNLWNWGNLGVNAASSIFGVRSQNRAIDRQIALQREENAARLAADAEARAEQRRQFDIQQQNDARRIAAEDEERSFTRSEREYQRRLLEEREARLAPYRAQADMARRRLAAFLGLR